MKKLIGLLLCLILFGLHTFAEKPPGKETKICFNQNSQDPSDLQTGSFDLSQETVFENSINPIILEAGENPDIDKTLFSSSANKAVSMINTQVFRFSSFNNAILEKRYKFNKTQILNHSCGGIGYLYRTRK